MEKGQQLLLEYFEKNASKRDKWKRRNRFYQRTIERQYSFIIPEGSTVLELGCSTGDLNRQRALGSIFRRRPSRLLGQNILISNFIWPMYSNLNPGHRSIISSFLNLLPRCGMCRLSLKM